LNTQTTEFVNAATVLGAAGAMIDRITSAFMRWFDPLEYRDVRRFEDRAAFNYAFYSKLTDDTFHALAASAKSSVVF
jgi:hypothetical protein